MPGEVGVPGVGVHEVGPLAGGGEAEVDAEVVSAAFAPVSSTRSGARRAVLVARLAERVDADVEVAAPAQGPTSSATCTPAPP